MIPPFPPALPSGLTLNRPEFLQRFRAVLFFLAASFLLFPGPSGADLFRHPEELSPQEKKDKALFDSCLNDASRGDAEAMGLLGLLYEKGRGTRKDYREALKWLGRGAKKGDPSAQNNLGFLYLKGLGVKADPTEALKWFQKAADQGLASAQENLGLLYGGGKGVKRDYEKAFGWFKKAAAQNDLEAQVNLGILYSLGQGGPKDFIESHKWFSLALKHESLGNARVDELRNDLEWLEKRMSDGEIQEARRRASTWKPLPQDRK